jgi:hypothetical protein
MTGILGRKPGAVSRRVANGVVILSRSGANPLRLDENGAVVWAAMGEATTVDSIVSALADQYQTDPVRLRGDVESVLGALDEAGALQRGESDDR